MIRKDLGRPPGAIFRRFDDNPLSAASIGQVHACVLPDGREAVIKLQRPNIRRRMTTDLRIMHRLARTLERHFEFARNSSAVAPGPGAAVPCASEGHPFGAGSGGTV